MVGLVSLLMVALPAQAGLGDLLDDLLDPVEDIPVVGDIVEPIVEDVVDPIVEDIVEPVAGDLVDPVVDEVLAPAITPIVDTVVTPIVDEVVTPVLDNTVPPVIETIPPVEPTTTTTIPVLASSQQAPAGHSAGFGISPSGYPGGVPASDSSGNGPGVLVADQSTSQIRSLEAALALQTALVDSNVTEPSNLDVDQPAPADLVEANWLNGLTNWLRSSADGLLNLLALPIRLLELLARALLTAGSGLIAPLSMLLAFTALLIKDRGWGRARA
jgi:hypothetical protein